MYRKILAFIFISIIMTFFSSCGLSERLSLDEQLYNLIEHKDDTGAICYKNRVYYPDPMHIIRVTEYFDTHNEEDVLLSWGGFRFGYITTFWSNRADSPIFIYDEYSGQVYLHEDYNYVEDIFVIDGTDIEVEFSSMFSDFSEKEKLVFSDAHRVELYSKKYTRIKTTLEIAFVQDTWYISFRGTESAWECSDAFIEVLKQNELI